MDFQRSSLGGLVGVDSFVEFAAGLFAVVVDSFAEFAVGSFVFVVAGSSAFVAGSFESVDLVYFAVEDVD